MNKPLLSEGRMYPLFRVVRRLAFVEAVVFFTAISSLDLLASALVLYAFRRFFVTLYHVVIHMADRPWQKT